MIPIPSAVRNFSCIFPHIAWCGHQLLRESDGTSLSHTTGRIGGENRICKALKFTSGRGRRLSASVKKEINDGKEIIGIKEITGFYPVFSLILVLALALV